MKKVSAVLISLILMISFTSCKNNNVSHSAYEKVYDIYKDLKSYTAKAQITIKTDKTENTYEVLQHYLAPAYYKMEIIAPVELNGTSYSFSDGRLNMNSEYGKLFTLEDYVPEDKGYVFVSDFFEKYYKSEETSVQSSNEIANTDSIMLKNTLVDSNPYRHSQCLWVSNDDLKPKKLVTYDIDNNETVIVVFEEFDYNNEIDKTLFIE